MFFIYLKYNIRQGGGDFKIKQLQKWTIQIKASSALVCQNLAKS